ncbi:MAG: hypothetical protein IIB56_06305 [Planctomycetes bacterium]|nr:hypothetical protein [Planctomycetota bacterium]MCH8120236.1 hypothetical protein [Planctomycetota bacterium]
MRQNTRNNSRVGNRLFNHLAVEKKKTALALCLITLMAFMWVRVLTRTEPQAAEAGSMTEQMDVETQSELKISFIQLPQVEGRNDVIARDFFASDGWQDFVDGKGRKSAGVEEVDIVSKNGDQEVIRKVAEKLKLEAIVSSENPLAFINDKVLRVGDKLLVFDGVDKYECEVVEIKENTVVMRCREARITLKLTQVN